MRRLPSRNAQSRLAEWAGTGCADCEIAAARLRPQQPLDGTGIRRRRSSSREPICRPLPVLVLRTTPLAVTVASGRRYVTRSCRGPQTPFATQQLSGLVALAERYTVPTGIRDMRVYIGRWAHFVTATAMPTAITWLASTWRVFSEQRIDRGFNTGAICQWQRMLQRWARWI